MVIKITLLIAICTLQSLIGRSQEAKLHDQIQSVVDKWRTEQQIPGLSLAVATTHRTETWTSGWADVETERYMQPEVVGSR